MKNELKNYNSLLTHDFQNMIQRKQEELNNHFHMFSTPKLRELEQQDHKIQVATDMKSELTDKLMSVRNESNVLFCDLLTIFNQMMSGKRELRSERDRISTLNSL